MSLLILTKPTLVNLNQLARIPSDQWHKFGVEYRSVSRDSQGFVTGGQLQDGRRFTFNQLKKSYQFTK
jgi:hypothetical protein